LPSEPTILAFDTSAAHCAAALLMGGSIVAEAHEEMARGQGERLAVMAAEVMAGGGVVWEELDAIGVGVGPGNFTGIRISVSFARGLGLALGVPAIGVTGFEAAMAHAGQPDGRVAVCLDSARNALQIQVFENRVSARDPFEADASEPLLPAFAASGSHGSHGLDSVVADLERASGIAHDLGPAHGSGNALEAIGLRLGADQARWIAAVARARVLSGRDHARPAPLYIRPADAAPSRQVAPKIIG